MTTFRQPKFLSASDEPALRIRCPIHGFIHFSENERKIIDHPLFRRLRHIRQLALTEYVYPGASHTRFEHTLGVMELASRAFDTLAAKSGELMETAFKAVPNFEDQPMAKARQVLRLAALMHDIGHASFSHAAEDVVFKDRELKHEALSCSILISPEHMGELLSILYWPECAEWAAQVIDGTKLPPQLGILRTLISGQMDVDRTDYLLRDSHHCGVDYGRFDHRRLIESLAITVDEMGNLQIALDKGGIHALEGLILARYQMNSQVYYHRLRRIYDYYLKEYHKELPEDTFATANDILGENDVTMLARMMQDAKAENGKLSLMAKRIINRDHHKIVHETGVDAGAEKVRRSKMILDKLRKHFSDVEFVHDVATGNIHKLQLEEDTSGDKLDGLRLLSGNTDQGLAGERSQVLKKIPRDFLSARIYADFNDCTPEIRKEIIGFAKNEWNG